MSLVYFRNWEGEKIKEGVFEYGENDQPLVDFLNKKAEKFIRQRISTVKTIYFEGNFVGYYAIAMSSITASDLFDEKRTSTLPHPAIIIGKLLIDKKHRNKKLGSTTIVNIVRVAQMLHKHAACRFIIVDAKKGVEKFYESNGFQKIMSEDAKKQTEITPMLFDLMPPK